MDNYTLSWSEGGNAHVIYARVSEAAATCLAEALKANAAFTGVALVRQETTTHAVTL